MTISLETGLLVLHSNRYEWLAEAVFQWMEKRPLQPLEEEIFLVQSNGVAEWLKMSLAAHSGICAAARVELPGRFLWRAYRQVLGKSAVRSCSALDKLSMTWRLMALLPAVVARPGFEPLRRFLADGDAGRRLQLAERLADLYDQYQVYRSDWLAAWEAGCDVLSTPTGEVPVPLDQAWQPGLWRELLATLEDSERGAIRSQIHDRFISALHSPKPTATPLARRIVVFGMTHVPMQTMEALAALATRTQVLVAIPNPSQYHWADIIDGRELLRMERRRHPLRRGQDLSIVAMHDMHAHGHPLLAAWGRQGRDFIRQLDAFDDCEATRQRFADTRIDLFTEESGDTLLQKVHAAIRDLEPLGAERRDAIPDSDHSIVFHIAHSAQREVEVLHDQLLALLAQTDGTTLQPRDIVVMVPDIASFAPSIRSVFGQYGRGDPRFIPFDIADLQERGNNPLLVALEWLLRVPSQRCRASEIRDLLDVPAVANRFDLDRADLPRLAQWIEGAGIRWGLDLEQRAGLGLEACGEQNTWMFGLRRMLLGFASGAGAQPFEDIEPYAEVGGLEASLAGSLSDLLTVLTDWNRDAAGKATPAVWGVRARALMDTLFAAASERERLTITAAHDALRDWLEACDLAGFEQPVPLGVLCEAWLAGIDAPDLNRRFRAGGVTFCTLLPMRAIPFEVVCLLGMNDGDFPRPGQRSDFDLMGLPGQRRPGDRSRRDDDRQLMLEALLSARRVLYVSWVGRSVRNNSEQPPSVLVSQLRDYLQAGWGDDVVKQRTVEHPLQPFSRRYFEVLHSGQDEFAHPKLFTFASEWRDAHTNAREALPAYDPSPATVHGAALSAGASADVRLTLPTLTSFLKNPVKHFFRHRLAVVFSEEDEASPDEELFGLDGLQSYGVLAHVARQTQGDDGDDLATLRVSTEAHLARIRRAGRLPMAEIGSRIEAEHVDAAVPMLAQWRAVLREHPTQADKMPLRFEHGAWAVEDWLDGLRHSASGAGDRGWMELVASRLCTREKPAIRPDKLLGAWVRCLVASACDVDSKGILVGRDVTVTVRPLDPDVARETLAKLLEAWGQGMARPLPVACLTAIAALNDNDAEKAYDGDGFERAGEVEDPCLSRIFPDFESLTADGKFDTWADQLYRPILDWINSHVTFEPHPRYDGTTYTSATTGGTPA